MKARGEARVLGESEMLNGYEGYRFALEKWEQASKHKVLFSKSQKLQLAAMRRKILRQDWDKDFQPLVDRVFEIWGEAIGTRL
jgi:hypothetical protein